VKPDPADIITQITRRQWLLMLGEGVALAGISGVVPEGPLRFFAEEQPPLPPGLYEPSADDLVHALSSHHPSVPPAGSETDYVQPGIDYKLQFFPAEDFNTITSFVSAILGDVQAGALKEVAYWVDLWFYSAKGVREAARNLDPLHRALAVAYFGEPSVTEIETADPAAVAQQGVAALNSLCRDERGKPFVSLAPAEQQQVLRSISTSADSTLRQFFDLVRNQAIRGYYTSAEGLRELDYKGNAYYPYCPGCESNQKS
jgi:Gluconate 2-dehydrogenase subunit 3